MEQPLACTEIARYCHEKNLNVWCYTGYTFEQLLEKSKKVPEIMDFLSQIDVLVDGKFIFAEKSYDVVFRGSKNQRLIDVGKSLALKKVVLHQLNDITYDTSYGRGKIKLYV